MAIACWVLGAASVTALLMLSDLTRGVPLFVTITLVSYVGDWTAAMLAAYVTNSRALMRAALWGIALLGLLPIVLAALAAS